MQRIAHTDQARRELDRTVRTADVLIRRLGVTRYPPELSRVVGYRPDGRAPYLVATRRGRPWPTWRTGYRSTRANCGPSWTAFSPR